MSSFCKDAGPTGPASRAPEIAREIAAAHRAQPRHVYTSVLNGFSAALSRRVAEAVSRDPRVAYVEQVLPTRAHATQAPTPSWGLDRIDQRTGLNSAYQYSNGAAGVRVYVVDSGIRIAHQEFGGRAVYGQNFDRTSSGQPPEDCSGHGTHVAGTIGGSTVGVAKSATLISVRVFGCNNSGFTDDLIAGIDYVTQQLLLVGGPAVANLSRRRRPGRLGIHRHRRRRAAVHSDRGDLGGPRQETTTAGCSSSRRHVFTKH